MEVSEQLPICEQYQTLFRSGTYTASDNPLHEKIVWLHETVLPCQLTSTKILWKNTTLTVELYQILFHRPNDVTMKREAILASHSQTTFLCRAFLPAV